MKAQLKKVQKDLQSAQAELSKLYEIVDNLEKTVGGVKPAKPPKPTPAPRKAARRKSKASLKGTATERVLGLIENNADGISMDAIIKETGLERNTIYGILNRAKKQNKVRSPKRGTYVAV